MKQRTIIILSVAAAVVVLGVVAAFVGPRLYRAAFVEPAASTPAVDTGAPATADSSLVGTWSAGGDSYAGYRVDEVLNGTDVTVTGRTEEVDSQVTTTDAEITDATITVDVASIATDSDRRDAYFRDTAMRVSEYPTATFTLTEPASGIDALAESGNATINLAGELSLAGVTNPVTVTTQAALDGDTVEVAGQIPVTFSDYGVEAPNLGFVQVEDSGFIEFHVVLEQA